MTLAGALATLLTGVVVANTREIPGLDFQLYGFVLNGLLVGALAVGATRLRDLGILP